MEQNVKNNGGEVSWFLSRLAAEKKKVVSVVCLLVLMTFMWARVLSDKGPQTAGAATGIDQIYAETTNQEKIIFVELPNVTGRNDVLTRDFFKVADWRNFAANADGKNLVGIHELNLGDDGAEDDIRRVAGKLRLEAIGFGKNPQAFINDKLLVIGDVLVVRDGVDIYEFKITGIEENKVSVMCGKAEITLKLAQQIEMFD